jgi:hypothetical protein
MRVGSFEDATCEGTNLAKSRYQPEIYTRPQHPFSTIIKCYKPNWWNLMVSSKSEVVTNNICFGHEIYSLLINNAYDVPRSGA